ncbi:MAG: NAD(P)-binding domain-containing protein [Bacteroidetes bacterium]|nr:NAD(P)-binding domain-containing protein [Bacteroidota bacterium]
MKIGILGTGNVGRTLGTGLIGLGHEVMIGSRDAAKPELQQWVADNGAGASAGTFADAAAHGEIVMLCTSWSGLENAIALATPANVAGKVVLDVTNPLDFSQGTPPRLAVGHTTSGGELVQSWLPDAHVVKVFNIVTAAFMVNGRFAEGNADMFIAGNNDDAKRVAAQIVTAFNWNCHDLGGIEAARILEYYALLWIVFGFRTGQWNHAFTVVRK